MNWSKLAGGALGLPLGPVGVYYGYKYGDKGVEKAGKGLEELGGYIGDGFDAIDPYDDKEAGLTGLQGKLGDLKKERLARIESVYGRANSQLDDTRKAIAAVYGDPSGWRL